MNLCNWIRKNSADAVVDVDSSELWRVQLQQKADSSELWRVQLQQRADSSELWRVQLQQRVVDGTASVGLSLA